MGIKEYSDEQVIELYRELKATNKVADVIGCHYETVRRVLLKHGVSRRPYGTNKKKKTSNKKSRCNTRRCEGIIAIFIVMGYKPIDITNIIGISNQSIHKAIKRSFGMSYREYVKKNFYKIEKQKLEYLYLDQQLTQLEIAAIYGVNQTTISYWLKKYEIRPDGHDSFRYRGGAIAEIKSLDERERIFSDYVSGVTSGRISYVSGYINKNARVIVRCNECGAHFERYANIINKTNNPFECPECVGKPKAIKLLIKKLNTIANNKPYEHTCVICGSVYMSAKDTTKYCSKVCYRKAQDIRKKEKIGRYSSSYHVARAIAYGCEYEHGIRLHKLIRRDHNICQICGKPCDVNDKRYGTSGPLYPSIDHIIPLAKGGSHTWGNVQLAHIICNSSKRDLVGDAAIEQANAQRAS